MGQSNSIARRRRRHQTSGAMPKQGKYARLSSPSRLPFRFRRSGRTRVEFKKIWRKIKRVNVPADKDQSDKMPLRRSRSTRSVSHQSLSSSGVSGHLSPSQSTGPDLGTVVEEAPLPVPKLDKNIDIVLVVEGNIQHDLAEALKKLLPKYEGPPESYPATKRDHNGPAFLWFKLPSNCKQRIFEFCFPAEDRKVSLTKPSFTAAVFPEGYFALPQGILEPVEGLLESCQALRKDTLTYFWSQYHFHITLNEFTNKLTCPLSHQWAVPYLHLIQILTIERDYTRLAGSHSKNAPQLSWAIADKKVRPMVDAIVDGLLKRDDGIVMVQLHLMARKYEGFRPNEGSKGGPSNMPYVPDEVEFNLSPILRLAGLPKRCRMSGFTRNFTKSMIRDLFTNGAGEIHYCAAKDRAWPGPMPPSPLLAAFVPTPNTSSLSFQLELPGHQEITWAKDVEEELERFASKLSESNVHEDVRMEKQAAHTAIDDIDTGELLDVVAMKSPETRSDHTSLVAGTIKDDSIEGHLASSNAVGSHAGDEITSTKAGKDTAELVKGSSTAKSKDTTAKPCTTERALEGNPSMDTITSQSENETSSAHEMREEPSKRATEGMVATQSDHRIEGTKNAEETTGPIGKRSDAQRDKSVHEDAPFNHPNPSMKPTEEVEPSFGVDDQNYTTAPTTPHAVGGYTTCGTFENHVRVPQPASISTSKVVTSTSTFDPSIPRSLRNNKPLPGLPIDLDTEYFPNLVPGSPLPPDSPTKQRAAEDSVRQIYTSSSDRINQITGCEKTIAEQLDAMNAGLEQDPAFRQTIQAIKRNSQSESQPQSQYERSSHSRGGSTPLPSPLESPSEQPTSDKATTGSTWRSIRTGRKSLFGAVFGGFNGARTPPA